MDEASMLFSLISATKIVRVDSLGAEEFARAASFLTGSVSARVLVAKDPRPFPVLDQALAEFLRGRDSLTLERIVPNPQTSDIMEMAAQARAFKPDLVIGIGGGSALDSAKAVRAMAIHEGDLDEYLGPQAARKLEKAGPKLLLIPTTTGTGAEVTKFGVYTARSGRKYSLAAPLLQADAALLAASLVADIPPALLAATAYDAVTHAMEPLWNKNGTALTDLFASDALVSLLKLFRPAYDARKAGRADEEARRLVADLHAAACAAGAAFNQTGTAAIHALSFILSEEWHVPHGAACAFFAEDVFDHNAKDPAVRAKLAAVAKRVYGSGLSDEAALKLLRDDLIGLKKHTGLPSVFSDLKADAAALTDARIAELFDKVQDDFKQKNNLPPMGVDAVRALVGAKRR